MGNEKKCPAPKRSSGCLLTDGEPLITVSIPHGSLKVENQSRPDTDIARNCSPGSLIIVGREK